MQVNHRKSPCSVEAVGAVLSEPVASASAMIEAGWGAGGDDVGCDGAAKAVWRRASLDGL